MADTDAIVLHRPELWFWGTRDQRPRMLHTMIRVLDLDRSIRFYVELLGMKQLSDRFDVPVRRVTAVFLGFDGYAAGGCLELVHSWDRRQAHTHGSGYGHVCIGAPDIVGTCEALERAGVALTLRPLDLLPGGPRVAFIKDPDGYDIELVETRCDRA